MSFRDEYMKDIDGEDELVLCMMVCDYCGKDIEWHNSQRDYDNPTPEMIQTSKDTDGWVSIDLHKYDGDEKRPNSVCVCAIMRHCCPECRNSILGLDSNGNLI